MNSFLATHTITQADMHTDTHTRGVYVLGAAHADLSRISSAGVCLGEAT